VASSAAQSEGLVVTVVLVVEVLVDDVDVEVVVDVDVVDDVGVVVDVDVVVNDVEVEEPGDDVVVDVSGGT
jgi:hypothetical protein